MRLIENDKIIIDKKIECEYNPLKSIIYFDDDFSHYIDIENKLFRRENDEYVIDIDINKCLFGCYLKNNNTYLKSDIKGLFDINNDTIHIKYSIDDDNREIIIHLL